MANDKYQQEKFERYSEQMGYRDFEEGEPDEDGRARYRNPNTQGRWNFWVASRDALASHTGEAEPAIAAREVDEATAMKGGRWVSADDIEHMTGELLSLVTGDPYTPTKMVDAFQTLRAALASREEAPATPPAATPAAPGEVTDAQIERMTALAFAATNDRGEMGLQKYWYGKGVREGVALSNPAPVAAPALKQWAWHWFGPDADEEWIAKALANLPPAALHPLLGVDQRGLEVAASFVQLHAPDSPLYDHLRSIAARIRPAPVAAPAPASEAVADEKLTVWFGSMPESNGKENWTAILYRKSGSLLGGIEDGFTLARSEYHDRVRYEADCVRHLIGELPERPGILAYDADMKSSAGDSADAPVQQAGHCERPMGCVCGGDLPIIRERCGNWVKGGA